MKKSFQTLIFSFLSLNVFVQSGSCLESVIIMKRIYLSKKTFVASHLYSLILPASLLGTLMPVLVYFPIFSRQILGTEKTIKINELRGNHTVY